MKALKPRALSGRQGDFMFWLMLIVPTLAIITIFIIIPLIDSVIKSFMGYKAANIIRGIPPEWNNFNNYIRLFKRGILLSSIGITFAFVTSVVVLQLILGLMLALVLNSGIRAARFLRSIMMIPWVVPTVISALIWAWIFQPQYGLFRYLVSLLTRGQVKDFAMLNNVNTALYGVEIAALWKQIPLMTLLLLAGLQNVPEDILEAAMLDGASGAVRLFKIVLPYMKSVIRVAVSMSIIENFKQFPLFWTMTGGGPDGATSTLAVLSYEEAFIKFDMGSGAAVTTLWMLIMIVVVFIYNRLFKKQELV